ncbi:uncharacterized protein L199_000260 [Kwoniella botswanensis]|uniref:uncharacterized protein n=1 Tax=Kwoniella botswanensis TaxID=1268659 RepID=UPI00315CF646
MRLLNFVKRLITKPQPESWDPETTSECYICREDIFYLVSSDRRYKAGQAHEGMCLWICEKRGCGSVFCMKCAIKWSARSKWTVCPACTRKWDKIALQRQYDIYKRKKRDAIGEKT